MLEGNTCNPKVYHVYTMFSFVVGTVLNANVHRFNGYDVLYCNVLWLMPPDALQPKAYCTNPGLQSLLLAPPGVSTRDPSSERRNYLDEKRPKNFA